MPNMNREGYAIVIEGRTLETSLEAKNFEFRFLPCTDLELLKEIAYAYDCEMATRARFKGWGLSPATGPIPLRFWVLQASNFDEVIVEVDKLELSIWNGKTHDDYTLNRPILAGKYRKRNLKSAATKVLRQLYNLESRAHESQATS